MEDIQLSKKLHIILNSSAEKNVIECPSDILSCLKTFIFQNVPSLTCPVKLEESMAGQKPQEATLNFPYQQQEHATF